MRLLIITTFFLNLIINISYSQNALYVSNSGDREIWRYDLLTEERIILDIDVRSPQGLKVDNQNEIIFYVDENVGSIRSYELATGEHDIIITGLNSPGWLAVDESSKIIYYNERLADAIFRINYDGSNNELIFAIPEPTNIEIDTINDKLFVVSDKTLYKLNLDGTSPEIIYTDPVEILDFDLDIINEQIYFSPFPIISSEIIRMEYDGTNPQQIFQHHETFLQFERDCEANKFYLITRGTASQVYEYLEDTNETKSLNFIDFNTGRTLSLENLNTCALDHINENQLIKSPRISPNPTYSELYVSSDEIKFEEYIIRDINFKIVKSGKLHDSVIQLGSLTAGLYTLTLTNKEQMSTHKFVKN